MNKMIFYVIISLHLYNINTTNNINRTLANAKDINKPIMKGMDFCMKLKKIGLIMLVLVSLGIFAATLVFAEKTKTLGIISIREGGYGYQANSKNVWKIVEYEGNNFTYNNAIYCLRAGQGFGDNSHIEKRVYNVSYDMKNYSVIPDSVKGILPSDTQNTAAINGKDYKYTNYNAVLALLDNFYLPKDKNASELKENIRKVAFPGVSKDKFVLTDDDIEVVQQLAIWYFSNPNQSDPYHMETLPALQLTTVEGGLGPFDKTLDDIDSTWQRQTQASQLYKFLIEKAKMNAELYGNGETRGNSVVPAEITDTKVTNEIIKGEIIVGPFSIKELSTDKNYKISMKVMNGKDTTKELSYKILDKDKKAVDANKKLEDLVNEEFYISIPEDKTIEKLNFELKILYSEKTLTFWTVSGKELLEQPVAIVENSEKEIEKKFETEIVRPEFDLALRKFITNINGTDVATRIPDVNVEGLKNGTTKTAKYTHPKTAVTVNTGDIVTYTIRIYNEGEMAGYAEKIADYIPDGLGFIIGYNQNAANHWKISDESSLKTVKLSSIPNATQNVKLEDFTGITSLNDVNVVTGKAKITTDLLKYKDGESKNLIQAFNKETGYIDYKDVKITCVVIESDSSKENLKNIAEIEAELDKYGAEVEDRDSTPGNVDINKYPSDSSVEDDDDYENLVIKDFDLALRKFITEVDGKAITNRYPVPVIDEGTGSIKYSHPKDVVRVKNESIVVYTIRVYNEGALDGYAKVVRDTLPTGLDFIPDNEINKKYGWKVSEDGRTVETTYLSKESSESNLIKAYNAATMKGPDYKDVKIACKVNLPSNSNEILINTAEIQDDSNKDGKDVTDQDSTPGNNKPGEDDIDTEKVQIVNFDLALRKFITGVNDEEITSRVPVVNVTEDGKITYTHPKDPVQVKNKDVVIYTIRVYNEGNTNGFATEIKDNVPEGLVFLPQSQINIEYGWKVSEDGKTITTNYLSEEKSSSNELLGFNKKEMATPNYKDVKVAFMVDEKAMPENRIIINIAEISKDDNEFDADDEDSTPNNGVEGEDDIDKEYLVVKYFDLSLLKWVTGARVTVNGKTTVYETGHTGYENPENPLKIAVNKRKIDVTDVKFIFKIKVTNEGQIAGYATELKDYIPEGLEFLQEDNPNWTVNEKGEVVTTQLKDTLLNPGESAEVEIVLNWIKDGNNIGLKTNVAEISEDKNDADSDDIDSTPDNQVPGEDDIDDAPVILEIETGSEENYLWLVATCLVIFGGGVYFIKRYVI